MRDRSLRPHFWREKRTDVSQNRQLATPPRHFILDQLPQLGVPFPFPFLPQSKIAALRAWKRFWTCEYDSSESPSPTEQNPRGGTSPSAAPAGGGLPFREMRCPPSILSTGARVTKHPTLPIRTSDLGFFRVRHHHTGAERRKTTRGDAGEDSA